VTAKRRPRSEPPNSDHQINGGGINGCGIARDAAGRGLSVLLCEQGDLGCGTSSASTKLIHGGLRYLEYYALRLVRESLREREVLLRMAPHIIWPLRFVLPHDRGLRPAWMVRLGLFLYDHLGGRERLPGTSRIDLASDPRGVPLKAGYRTGFVYSDCWVDDARLVVLNALDAHERGADIRPRHKLLSARREARGWAAEIEDLATGQRYPVTARGVVNAGGPWASEVLRRRLGGNAAQDLRLVKGSHIVVRRLFDHDDAYIFQNPDRRIVFAIPYELDFTLIGTTEVEYDGDPGEARISGEETDYLCRSANAYFRRAIAPGDVVWTYSGVRPLHDARADTASAASREYTLDLDLSADGVPLLNVFGGKITTYRRLAEQAVDLMAPLLGSSRAGWTGGAPLPGGDIPDADFATFRHGRARVYPWLPEALLNRYARAYGTRMDRVVGDATSLEGLGKDLGGGLLEAELEYLADCEWAQTAEDVLWRRSKLGLRVPEATPGLVQARLDRRGRRTMQAEAGGLGQ
jgi:glycerol-3-phosphate dehydrogenase